MRKKRLGKAKNCKIIIGKFQKSKHIYENTGFIALFNKKNLCLFTKYCDQFWCIDSEATSHLCNNKSFFVHMDNNFDSAVQLANEKELDIKSSRTVQLTLKVNRQIKTSDLLSILYVPELRCNLISTRKPTNEGCRVIMKKFVAGIIRIK